MLNTPYPLKRIMVVDPSPDDRKLITTALQQLYPVRSYEAPQEALLDIVKKQWIPDVVFLSFSNPGENDGYTAMKSLRALSSSMRIFILLEARNPLQAYRGSQLGATAAIEKPLTRQQVLHLVVNALHS